MFIDAHYHPFDLFRCFPQADREGRQLQVLAAASACNMEGFAHNERLALETAAQIFQCFAVHPQQFAVCNEQTIESSELLAALEMLASEGRLAAVGEFGFDLYNPMFKETEAAQDKIFAEHLNIAIHYDLPVVLHVRRAMHKIFAAAGDLAKCRAVVFHSWPGTLEEGQALLRRKVNVYFSFGNIVLNGHKHAMRCCALFPAQRLLTETDAPYQPRRGKNFSHWEDLPVIVEAVAALRRGAESPVTDVKELEAQIKNNFRSIFL